MDYLGCFHHPPILASVAIQHYLILVTQRILYGYFIHDCFLSIIPMMSLNRQRFDDFLCEKKFNLQG